MSHSESAVPPPSSNPSDGQPHASDTQPAIAAPQPDHRDARLGGLAAGGMALATLVALWGKGSSFLTNLVLGWLLGKDDFGLYAIAIALTALVIVVSDGGTVRLLRKPEDFLRFGRTVASISLGTMFAAALLMAAFAFPAARYYDDPRLAWMILIVAINLPLGNRPYLLRTRLSAELRFRDLARVDAIQVTTRNVALLALAALGLGPLSFVLSNVLATLVDLVVLRRLSPAPIEGEKLDRATLSTVLHASKWIVLGALAGTIIVNGAVVVIRQFNDTAIVGIYFFGVQVAVAPTMLLTTGLRTVLLPTMARMSHDIPRQAAAFVKSMRLLSLASGPVGVFSAVICGPMTHLLWRGKWDESIPVIQFLTLALTFRIANMVGGSMLEARGEWRLRTTLQWIDAATILLAAWIGAAMHDMTAVAACIAAQMTIMGFVHCIVAGRLVLLPARRVFAALLPAPLLAAGAGFAAWWAIEHWMVGWSDLLRAIAAVALTAAALGAAFAVGMPHRLREVLAIVADRRRMKPAPPAPPGAEE